MSFFYKITYSQKDRRLSIYNWGCNFNCKVCTYKIAPPYNGERPLQMEEIKRVIKEMRRDIKRVHFLGGEPTINPYLPELIKFVKELGLTPYLGHTNGTNLIEGIEGMVVSIKAISEELHIEYTGRSNREVLKNLKEAYSRGIDIKTNTVFVPGYVDSGEIEKIARFLSSISESIPFHIIGYLPVPGLPYRRPEREEILKLSEKVGRFLSCVSWSLPSSGSIRSAKIYP